jgi:hypothetical protein
MQMRFEDDESGVSLFHSGVAGAVRERSARDFIIKAHTADLSIPY